MLQPDPLGYPPRANGPGASREATACSSITGQRTMADGVILQFTSRRHPGSGQESKRRRPSPVHITRREIRQPGRARLVCGAPRRGQGMEALQCTVKGDPVLLDMAPRAR